MCGVAGFLDAVRSSSADALRAAVERMTERIAYRGPDDAGAWVDAAAGVALGHRRLSILDLSPEGHQPMSSEDGRLVLSYNGEIYNHRELRAELEPRGHRFRGHSDTEVLLAAISEWGLGEALRRSNGMFGAALWDRGEGKLHLFRDRFGEKPMFCGWAGRTFLFGSELKALRAHPAFRPDVDPEALALFLRLGFVPAPRCIFRGLAKVRPGTIATASPDQPGHLSISTWWSAREAVAAARRSPFEGDAREAADELERLLRDSVRLRMVADVPVGAFLSGGLDSSTVVALMQAQCSQPVRTFTIGFGRDAYDEAPRARAVAAHLGTSHTERYPTTPDLLSVVTRLPERYDEPFSDSSQIPTLLVAELARRSVTVGLSGDGGDELFGGYARYRLGRLAAAARRVPSPVRRALVRAIEVSPPSLAAGAERALRGLLGLRPREPREALRAVSSLLGAGSAGALYRYLLTSRADGDVLASGAPAPASGAGDEEALPPLTSFVEQMMFWDTIGYLPDDILAKVDRATMSVSLEARVPLLDPRVFDLAWRLPAAARVGRGPSKAPIRAVLDRYVPRALVDRPKHGFAVPLGEWLRGPLRSWARDLFAPGRLEHGGLLDGVRCRALLEEHLSGAHDRHDELWNALVFQAWVDADRPGASRGLRTGSAS